MVPAPDTLPKLTAVLISVGVRLVVVASSIAVVTTFTGARLTVTFDPAVSVWLTVRVEPLMAPMV